MMTISTIHTGKGVLTLKSTKKGVLCNKSIPISGFEHLLIFPTQGGEIWKMSTSISVWKKSKSEKKTTSKFRF